jgi:hypothetical protein
MSFTTFEQADREAKKREAKRNPFASEMSMRDYFAAKAMQSIFAANVEWEFTGTPMDEESLQLLADVAQDAYAMADAMLRAREAA